MSMFVPYSIAELRLDEVSIGSMLQTDSAAVAAHALIVCSSFTPILSQTIYLVLGDFSHRKNSFATVLVLFPLVQHLYQGDLSRYHSPLLLVWSSAQRTKSICLNPLSLC